MYTWCYDDGSPHSPGMVMIKCDNMEANQRDCYGVVHNKSRVSTDYVRMASVLYTKQWATKDFWNRSKRILLDPSFSVSGSGFI